MVNKNIYRVTLERATNGHLLWCQSQNYSDNTIIQYKQVHKFLIRHFGADAIMDDITLSDIQQFMAHLANETYTPYRGAASGHKGSKKPRQRSRKTLSGYRVIMLSLWAWAVDNQYAAELVPHQTPAPKVYRIPPIPLTTDELSAMFASTKGKSIYDIRNRAILAFMLDTAVRPSELCNLQVRDVQMGQTYAVVRQGKGKKDRMIPFSNRCASLVQRWMMVRPDEYTDDSPLFANLQGNVGQAMERQNIMHLLKSMGKRAGVTNVTSRRMRVTAACLMVSNGMSAWELKRIMGHENITTTMKYVEAADVDLAAAIKQSSPLKNVRI